MPTEAPTFPLFGQNPMQFNRSSNIFPDPFLDYASTQMPRDIYDVIRWCEFVWLNNGTYRMAMQRVVRYFLTRIELTDASDDEKEKYEDFLENHLKFMRELSRVGDNMCAYGNDFISVHVPFRRNLRCPRCKGEQPVNKVAYEWRDWQFVAKCNAPKCKYQGAMIRVDRRSIDEDKIRLIHWPAREMRLIFNPTTSDTAYYWDMPADFKDLIRRGNTFHLEHTPWEIIEAVRHDQMFHFDNDVIYHCKMDVISGVRHFGWGIPLIMSNFKQAWYIQVLKRYNEAFALDYIMPFRVITPVAGGTSREADPLLQINMAGFQSKVFNMWREHRRDPTAMFALPFPVQMDMLGAEGRELAPTDLIDKATDEFLNALGVPAQMYRGDLQWQAMPAALRLFERTWVSLVEEMNGFINWTFKRVSDLQNWENLKGRLQPVTYADDLEKKQMQLQLAAGNQISKQTAFAPFGINYRDEIRRQLEEQKYMMEQQQRFQEEEQQKDQLQSTIQQGAQQPQPGAPPVPGQPQPGGQPGQPPAQQAGAPTDPSQGMAAGPNAPGNGGGGAMPGGGMMPAGPSGGVGGNEQMTPEDLTEKAQQIATQLLGMPYELRRQQLNQIKKSNETLHSLVIAQMDKIRQQAQTAGGFQQLQQMVGAGASQ